MVLKFIGDDPLVFMQVEPLLIFCLFGCF